MEAVFILTHIVMFICLIIIIAICIPSGSSDGQEAKRTAAAEFVQKIRLMRISPISIYRAAAGLLALFIK